MNYVIVEEGIIENVMVLYPSNAADFPEAVFCGELPVMIGDTYDGEHFYRNSEQVVVPQLRSSEEREDMQAALEVLGVTVNG